ncbi:hypothetical protein BWQ96_00217 [Gracilariopsis chorda]|uniref:Uncharacterized protein n=1 Tax=Gracilariopsis chorda TaxID=448386 RepID=A0A2V3J8L1_9FLOR|nr:hypothetical protein BWQ96_00217 [Gracilariopsis chorda]|eukprot:PXF50057.1 hypothetical protein BWQ96_00217 [Gracilariopsis chorda]
MNSPFRQPDRKEMMAMLKANTAVLTVYFGLIRVTPPQLLDFGYAAYKHYSK